MVQAGNIEAYFSVLVQEGHWDTWVFIAKPDATGHVRVALDIVYGDQQEARNKREVGNFTYITASRRVCFQAVIAFLAVLHRLNCLNLPQTS